MARIYGCRRIEKPVRQITNNAVNKPPQKHGGHEVVAGWAANFNIIKVATFGIVLTAFLWAYLLMNNEVVHYAR